MLKIGTDNKPVDAVQNTQKKLTPKWTTFLTPTAYSVCNLSATVGNEQGNFQENGKNDNCLNSEQLGIKKQAAVGFEPTDNGFANRRLRPLGYAARL